MSFSTFVRKLLVGTPWGEVFPRKIAPIPPATDARTAALRILRRYISELTFLRENKEGQPSIPIRIPAERIHIEWPDEENETGSLPAVAFISGSAAEYQPVGLACWIDEDSWNKFGRNTGLNVSSNVVETVNIEILASTKHERRAIAEGIKTALLPTEFMYGLRFKVPDYYDQVVTFSVQRKTIVEVEDSAKGRRLARIEVEMSFYDVQLINVVPMIPEIMVLTDHDPEAPLTRIELTVLPHERDAKGEADA